MDIKCSRLQWTISHDEIICQELTRTLSHIEETDYGWTDDEIRTLSVVLFRYRFNAYCVFRNGQPRDVGPNDLLRLSYRILHNEIPGSQIDRSIHYGDDFEWAIIRSLKGDWEIHTSESDPVGCVCVMRPNWEYRDNGQDMGNSWVIPTVAPFARFEFEGGI